MFYVGLSPREERYYELTDASMNIDYATAYLKYYQDTWQGDYPNIANDPGVLGTLYNRTYVAPHSNPQPSQEFGVFVQQHYNAMGYLLGI